MELRHLRYFLAVAEALNFTKAAAMLRVAQPALSRRVQDLEDEIGVDLLKRSPRGGVLTAEGKLFLDKTRQILKLADESVEQVRALARGEEGELHMGYAPAPTVEILPPALAAFQKAFPRVSPGISGGHFGAARMARAGPILTPIGVKSRIIPNWRHSRQESRIRLSRVGRHPPGGHATDTYGHGSDKPGTATDTMDTTDSPDTTIGSSSSTDCGHLSRT